MHDPVGYENIEPMEATTVTDVEHVPTDSPDDGATTALKAERDRAKAAAARCAERCRQMQAIVAAAKGLDGVRVPAYADGEKALYRLRDALEAYEPVRRADGCSTRLPLDCSYPRSLCVRGARRC